MIWSSFLIESRVGPPSVRDAIVPAAIAFRVELSWDIASDTEPG